MTLEATSNDIKDLLTRAAASQESACDIINNFNYYVPDAVIQRRYMFSGDVRELALRAVKLLEDVPRARPHLSYYYEMIAERRFIPAGNTLVAGIKPLQPNCSIIGRVYEQNYDEVEARCRVLWASRIGVGFDLSFCLDPVAVLLRLSAANHAVDVGDWRPKRGNIATLSIDHPRVMEFVRCKSGSREDADRLYNFNISVAVSDKFMKAASLPDTRAAATLRKIAKHAHAYGDPGLVFIDRAQDGHEPIVTAVPCGEQFMHTDETCNLGAINLDAFVGPCGSFDVKGYRKCASMATRFLDTMVDLLEIPDKAMAERTRALRRVGLGVMGFATALQAMGIPYESESALRFGAYLASILTSSALETSILMAEKLGGHAWDGMRRNISVTCIAPTGGIRRLVGTDGFAIEPLFSSGKRPSPEFEVRMAGAWQRHIENAISKTVVLPGDATPGRIRDLFLLAYEHGCKGITVYRDGSRSNQPIKVCDGDSCETVLQK